ncbi:MAG: DUF4112 domain-containing protein [Pseudolabrys sp.]|nr:DUF4112 domain-containing protein [Pseudolabrys sp.]
MAQTRTIEIIPPGRRSNSERARYTKTKSGTSSSDFNRRAALERLDWIANLMDSAVIIPGTQIRVGLDALIGLAPGIGDTVTTMISLWMVKEAHALGAPKHIIMRMVGNVALDGLVGAVPLLGDAFDVMFRANRRNIKLLREHFEREGVR